MPLPEKRRDWVVRGLFGLVTAVVVSSTAYLCAWSSFRGAIHFGPGQELTRAQIQALREAIERHRADAGMLPPRLEDLALVKAGQVHVDGDGRPVDAWGRPLHYAVKGDEYELTSFGRDGEPGGAGEDTDLSAAEPRPPREMLTLWQFTTAPEARGMLATCLLAGLVAFPICFLNSRAEQGARLSLVSVLVVNAVTALFAILAAVVISAVHLPSGH